MPSLRANDLIVTWIALIAVTILAFLAFKESELPPKAASLLIVLLAAVKVRLVMRNFMELKLAPAVSQRLADVWIACCVGGILIEYYASR